MKFFSPEYTLNFLVYGFLAWLVEVVYYAIREKKFVNRGLLSFPVDFEIGVVFANISVLLPQLEAERNYIGMFVITLASLILVRAILGFLAGRLTKRVKWLEQAPSGSGRSILLNVLVAAGILGFYLLMRPVMMVVAAVLPQLLLKIIHYATWILLALDLITSIIAMRKGKESLVEKLEGEDGGKRISTKIAQHVWKRLERAYPGISDSEKRESIVFAQGMSLDKLIWVFLISALLGDLIETVFCRITGGTWMSRSSVIFGPFSFVWGIGAVLLTVSLMRLKDKEDRWILIGGALLGGAFEYMCSVFTEIVFGKVFWDYSHIPFNIGGRTNLLYMIFWGILGLFWVKIAYPPLDRFIEKFPPVVAKVFTWLVIVLMALDGLLTGAVLLRYNSRKTQPEPANVLERFIDNTYDDEFVEHRWQNMHETEVEPIEGGYPNPEGTVAEDEKAATEPALLPATGASTEAITEPPED